MSVQQQHIPSDLHLNSYGKFIDIMIPLLQSTLQKQPIVVPGLKYPLHLAGKPTQVEQCIIFCLLNSR